MIQLNRRFAWPSPDGQKKHPEELSPRFAPSTTSAEKTFHKILKRARTEGQAAALEPRSRRPKTSPNSTSEPLKDQAVAMRKSMEDTGWDHGPISVHDQMRKLGMQTPSIASLARIFSERGLVTPAPQKPPRSSHRSVRCPMPNACWQLDAAGYVLEGGRKCVIFQLPDDHSRPAVASMAAVDRLGARAPRPGPATPPR